MGDSMLVLSSSVQRACAMIGTDVRLPPAAEEVHTVSYGREGKNLILLIEIMV
jgi:hypothetical protein